MNGRRLADFSLRPLFKVAGLSLGTIGLVLGGVSLVRGDRAAMGLVVVSIAGIAGGLLLPWRGPEPLRRALAGELTERVALSQQIRMTIISVTLGVPLLLAGLLWHSGPEILRVVALAAGAAFTVMAATGVLLIAKAFRSDKT